MQQVKVYAQIGVVIFFYYMVYYFYVGILHPIPALGDSFDYHIPISQSILNGSFMNPGGHLNYLALYYPGSSEAINSIFILLGIPLTISNLVAAIALFFVCFYFAQAFQKDKYYSLLYSVAVCTLTVFVRWFNAVSIDIWLACYILLAIVLLSKPKTSYIYSLFLGIVCGMIIGTKYTGIVYLLLLLLIWQKNIRSIISLKRLFIFLIPFFFLGIFWYIRNWMIVGNPLYGFLCIANLPCQHVGKVPLVINSFLSHPSLLLNALFSEYKLWLLSPLIVLYVLVQIVRKNINLPTPIFTKLALFGLFSFAFYFVSPTTNIPWTIVSTLRYTYPAYISLLFCIFLYAQKVKKTELLGLLVVSQALPTLTMSYFPKLIFLFIPLSLGLIYFIEYFLDPEKDNKVKM